MPRRAWVPQHPKVAQGVITPSPDPAVSCCLHLISGVLLLASLLLQEFEAGLLLLLPDSPDSKVARRRSSCSISSCYYKGVTAAEAGGLCSSRLCKLELAQLLASDLREAVIGCKKQLGELMAQSTMQMMLVSCPSPAVLFLCSIMVSRSCRLF